VRRRLANPVAILELIPLENDARKKERLKIRGKQREQHAKRDVEREVDSIDKSIVVDIGDGSIVEKLAESESLVRVISSY